MTLQRVASGNITEKHGLRVALAHALKERTHRNSVIRIVSNDLSGWIGISFGQYITGARAQFEDQIIEGVPAIETLLSLTEGAYDLILVGHSHSINEKLRQSLGIGVEELLYQSYTNPSKPLAELLALSTISELVREEDKEDSKIDFAPDATLASEVDGLRLGLPDVYAPDVEDMDVGEGVFHVKTTGEQSLILASAAGASKSFVQSDGKGTQFTLPDRPELAMVRLSGEVKEFNKFLAELVVDDEHKVPELDETLAKYDQFQRSLVLQSLESALSKAQEDLDNLSQTFSGQFNLSDLNPQGIEIKKGTRHKRYAYFSERPQEEKERNISYWLKKSEATGESPQQEDVEKLKKATKEIPLSVSDQVTVTASKISARSSLMATLAYVAVTGLGVLLLTQLGLTFFASTNEADVLKIADGFREAGRNAQAVDQYQKVLAMNPRNKQAYIGRAQTWGKDEAKFSSDLMMAASLGKNDPQVLSQVATMFYERRMYDNALIFARSVLKLPGAEGSSYILAAKAALESGDLLQSEDFLEEAHKRGVRGVDQIFARLFVRAQNNQKFSYADRSKMVARALALDPGNWIYQEAEAELALESGDLKRASAILARTVKDNPDNGRAYFLLAKIGYRQKNYREALSDLEMAEEKGYKTGDFHELKGRTYLGLNNLSGAFSNLSEAYSQRADDRELRKLLNAVSEALQNQSRSSARIPGPSQARRGEDSTAAGLAALNKGRYGQAIDILDGVIRHNPNDAHARMLMARCLFQKGRFDAAVGQYAAAEALGSLPPSENIIYGRALAKSGNFEQSIRVFRSCLDANPTWTDARVQLIKTYTLAGFAESARKECEQGIAQAQTEQERRLLRSIMP